MKRMKSLRVLVTGGTGFVGRHILQRLKADGVDVTSLIRHYGDKEAIERMGFRAWVGNIWDGETIEPAFRDIDAVIHLVGIIHPYGKNSFERVHVEGTANVVRWSRRNGVKKIIHMSALGTRAGAVSRYHKTKWAGEEIVRLSGIDHTIFRPSVIFGEKCEFLQIMESLIRKPLITPVAGLGKNLMQPVHVDDVAASFAQALSDERCRNRTFELGGADRMSMDQIIDALTMAMGKRWKLKMHIPAYLLKFPLLVLEYTHPRPPLSRDQLKMLREDNICDMAEAKEVFPLKFSGLREWLAAGRGH